MFKFKAKAVAAIVFTAITLFFLWLAGWKAALVFIAILFIGFSWKRGALDYIREKFSESESAPTKPKDEKKDGKKRPYGTYILSTLLVVAVILLAMNLKSGSMKLHSDNPVGRPMSTRYAQPDKGMVLFEKPGSTTVKATSDGSPVVRFLSQLKGKSWYMTIHSHGQRRCLRVLVDSGPYTVCSDTPCQTYGTSAVQFWTYNNEPDVEVQVRVYDPKDKEKGGVCGTKASA